MVISVILAGGTGMRSGQNIPKQFISVFDKMLIIYTLEAFQEHPLIDGIIVSCVAGWEEALRASAKDAEIGKLRKVVPGGDNAVSSTEVALLEIEGTMKQDDIVVIHDSVRPCLSEDIITDCIRTAEKYGSGLSAIRCQETIVCTDDGVKGSRSIHRDEIMRVQTPQAYKYGKVLSAYRKAGEKGLNNAVYTNTMMLDLGDELFFSKGSERNIKVTNREDISFFKALYSARDKEWFK